MSYACRPQLNLENLYNRAKPGNIKIMLIRQRGAGLITLIFGIALLAVIYNLFLLFQDTTKNVHQNSDSTSLSTSDRSAMEASYEVACRANILSITQQLHIYELSNPAMRILDLPRLFHPGRYPLPHPGSGCRYELRGGTVYCVKHSNH